MTDVDADGEDADPMIEMIKSYVIVTFTRDGLLRASMIPGRLTLSTPLRATIWVKLSVKDTADGGLKWSLTYGDSLNFSMTAYAQVCVAKPVRVELAPRNGGVAPPTTFVLLKLWCKGEDSAQVVEATVPMIAFHSPRALNEALAPYAFPNGRRPAAVD